MDNRRSDISLPIWEIDLGRIDGNSEEISLSPFCLAVSNSLKVSDTTAAAVIPKGEWVYISTYSVKSPYNGSRIGVWIKGEEAFSLKRPRNKK
ncbi:MAG: hypothetical protein V2J07_08920 [Anaerolineae bacterium]|jgi:hypothetical protein|nr:hypothetical protein [Anaerolineae bacterium]